MKAHVIKQLWYSVAVEKVMNEACKLDIA